MPEAPLRLLVIASHFSGVQVIRHIHSQFAGVVEIVYVITDDPSQTFSNVGKRAIWDYGKDPLSVSRFGLMVPLLCDQLGLPCYTGSVRDEAFLQLLANEIAPDVGLMSIFGQRLPPQFIDAVPGGIYNFHPCGQTWPSYPGPSPHRDMLEAGEPFFRMAVHRVVEKVGAGEALFLSDPVAIPNGVTEIELTWITQSAVVYSVSRLLKNLLPRHLGSRKTESSLVGC